MHFGSQRSCLQQFRLGVFEALHEGSAESAELAARLEIQPDGLERLLEACAGLGLLRKTSAGYANQPVAEAYLCDHSPLSMTGYIRYSDEALFPMWAHLEDAVREGSHRWTQTFGWQGSLFEHFFKTPERRRSFLRGMHGFGQLGSPAVVAAFDLSRFTRLVDLGGATGHLAMAACVHYPSLRAVVFDLPIVIEIAGEYVQGSPVRDRIELVRGDFFQDELPAGDLYTLGRILHDWREDRIRTLLKKIHQALPPGGAILLAEKLLDEDRSGPGHAHLQSLNMLVCTEGKERTFSEYAALLHEAGFAQGAGAPYRRSG